MYLDKILIFILFLGPLVFFHELGHFFFARLFGVRVEVFSIGFGPKIFSFKRGDTQYAVSLIPLGGYVKMFGDDPLNKDAVPVDERRFSFTHKNKWQRFWIVLGGPLANIIIAYLLFAGIFISGETSPELRVGRVNSETTFHQLGFRSGDIVKEVNGKKVNTATDIALGVEDKIDSMTVSGEGRSRVVQVDMSLENFFGEFVKYSNVLQKPLLVNKKGEIFVLGQSNSFDWNTSLDKFQAWFSEKKTYKLYPYEGNLESKKFDEKIDLNSGFETTQASSWKSFLKVNGLRSLDMMIASIEMNSAADTVGLKERDIILKLNDIEVYNFMNLRETLQKTSGDTVSLTFWRDGKILRKELSPKIMEVENKKLKLIGVRSGGIYFGPKRIEIPGKGLITAITLAGPRTWESIIKTLQGFKKLILGEGSVLSAYGLDID